MNILSYGEEAYSSVVCEALLMRCDKTQIAFKLLKPLMPFRQHDFSCGSLSFPAFEFANFLLLCKFINNDVFFLTTSTQCFLVKCLLHFTD